jgi:predicted metal-dependent hydrolase
MENTKRETTTKAKKKLKAHLDRYIHEEEFTITERKVLYWFGVINRALFGGNLPLPKFEIKNMKSNWGECVIHDNTDLATIRINAGIDSRNLFVATLAHEMVHQWQHINENRMSHATSYLMWKREVKKKFNIVL